MTRLPRLLLRIGVLLLVLLLLAAAAGWWAVRGSLPRLDGAISLPGLSAKATIERDALGVVTIQAANEADAARALGYVHGQERFFEMDLLRRSAAGELSELFGRVALEKDQEVRVHRLRWRVNKNLASILGNKAGVLDAYAQGVNAGVAQLQVKPWPYLLLRTQPQPWLPADTVLAGYAMFFDLQDETNSRELALWKIREAVPAELFRLISADGTQWDAPLAGHVRGNIALPSAAELDLRKLPAPPSEVPGSEAEPAAPGSNNFAVAGSLTADHRAIVADDMHLTLRAPNIWFRARLQYADAAAPGGKVDVSGFTLPGIPAVIVGSNGHVAWGFTNSYGDWLDFYRVRFTDAGRTRYATAAGEHEIETIAETIKVKGEASQPLEVRQTIWGPITGELDAGQGLALRWAAHEAGSINLGLASFAAAANLDDALARAGAIGMPAQNLVLGDASGRIAWRLTAQLPRRTGDCEMQAPIDPASGCEWTGWGPPERNPSLVDPPSGRLWSANARTLDGPALAQVGDAGYANGARARQIRDALFARDRFTERDLLAIQIDDRALFLQRWHALMRKQAAGSNDPAWKQIERATRRWEGRASPESVSYRITRAWRLAVLERIKTGLMAPAMVKLGSEFVMPDLPQIEGVAWQLLASRPDHLLPQSFASWDALLLDAAASVTGELQALGPLGERTWGERNTAAICHPLARALPSPARPWLCMPGDAIAGDGNMPRVASPTFGASQRMVVSPGHEDEGLIHMPGGQSGHPMSPFWGAGHATWVRGEPAPFLPGATLHSIELTPR